MLAIIIPRVDGAINLNLNSNNCDIKHKFAILFQSLIFYRVHTIKLVIEEDGRVRVRVICARVILLPAGID